MNINDKAMLLAKVLEKHNPEATKEEAYKLMVRIDNYPLPDDLKRSIKQVCAANIEVMEVFM